MMAIRMMINLGAVLLCLLLVSPGAWAAEEPTWPREVTVDGNNVVVHQPQIDEWKDYTKIEARMVVEITPPDEKKLILGALWVTADTDANLETRVVKLSNLKIAKTHFPALDEEASKKMTQVLKESLPKNVREVSVDRILANLKRTKEADRTFEGASVPPKILISETPAILVQFDGKPAFYPVDRSGLKFAVNTNWDLFVDEEDKTYYLLNGEEWLTTKDLQRGPWTHPASLPSSFSKIPDDKNWSDVRGHLTVKSGRTMAVPRVLVSTTPAELIVIDGKPKLSPIEGTDLSSVSNADEHLFYYGGDQSYYYLVSGRWFKTESLQGPWKAVGKNLPQDFAKLPAEGSLEEVLASVPGTPQAEEALIQAAIPQKAVVKRKEAKLDVKYNGEPKFEPIKGTALNYAVNTPTDVIQVGVKYYACVNGVWFVSDSPNGPWVVADSVPEQIYQIPPSSPVYRTSYVYVYDSTEDEVEFGYTAGYLGCYEQYGTVVYGTGYYYPPYFWPGLRPIFWPRPYSYGFAAYYNPFTGGFLRAGVFYGPYRGIGRGAVYNPWTGSYARGVAVWGPRGAAWAGIAYTPYTGWVAGGGSTFGHRPGGPPISPYARWGSAAASAGAVGALGTLASRDRLNALRNSGRMRPGQGRPGALRDSGRMRSAQDRLGAVRDRGKGQFARDGAARGRGKLRDDLYVGRDGNIYKRAGKGRWQQYTRDRRWKPVAETRDRATGRPLRDGAGPGDLRRPADRRAAQQRLQDRSNQQQRLRDRRAQQQRAEQQRVRQQRQLQQRARQQRLRQQRTRPAGNISNRAQRGRGQVVRGLNRDALARSRGQQRVTRRSSYQGRAPSFGRRGVGGGGGMRRGGFRGGGGRRR